MKEKIKKIIFGYLPGFVLGVITAISISVIAATYFPSKDVTYDNKESGLTSTDVQGAIDELYLTCTAEKVDVGGQEVTTVISGDGLYKDEYEEGKYTYKGANPNNYVTFNNEKAGWRIISINDNKTIKIIILIFLSIISNFKTYFFDFFFEFHIFGNLKLCKMIINSTILIPAGMNQCLNDGILLFYCH